MSSKLILLVDDELYVTNIVARQLRSRGYELVVACDGAEALVLIRDRHPDLIVSDYQMPELSGMEMAHALHEDPATAAIPILMLTAREHCLEESELKKTSIRAFVAKPFSMKDLISKIDRLLTPQTANDPPSQLRKTA